MAATQENLWYNPSLLPSYTARTGLVLGFHGTDLSIVHDLLLNVDQMRPSFNAWDWIGHGVYFWEHSPSRAIEFAETLVKRKHSRVKRPAVIGAVLDLGNCLDLLDYKNLANLRLAYGRLGTDVKLLENKTTGNKSEELFLRYLDCAVLEQVHRLRKATNKLPFDSVRAVFWEGKPLYPNAGFREKNHIQICIRNPNCIKGLFLPRLR